VDAGDIRKPGTYTFDLSPSVPPGIIVRGFSPEQVTVVLEEERPEEAREREEG
jgi:hypothetical protein